MVSGGHVFIGSPFDRAHTTLSSPFVNKENRRINVTSRGILTRQVKHVYSTNNLPAERYRLGLFVYRSRLNYVCMPRTVRGLTQYRVDKARTGDWSRRICTLHCESGLFVP